MKKLIFLSLALLPFTFFGTDTAYGQGWRIPGLGRCPDQCPRGPKGDMGPAGPAGPASCEGEGCLVENIYFTHADESARCGITRYRDPGGVIREETTCKIERRGVDLFDFSCGDDLAMRAIGTAEYNITASPPVKCKLQSGNNPEPEWITGPTPCTLRTVMVCARTSSELP